MNKFIGILILLSLLLTSCSIFDGLYPDEGLEGDAETLIAKGDAALKEGDAYKAWSYYDEAVKKEPKNSKARWNAASAYILYKNVDLLLISSKLLAGQDPASVISSAASSLQDTMSKVIGYLDPIAKGECDNQISKYDANVNLNLALAYIIRGFIQNGDKPQTDGNYFSTGDIFIFQNGNFTYNTNVVKIESYQKSLGSSFEEIINSLNQTPPSAIPGSSISNIIYNAHNIIEDLLFVYNIMESSFNDFSGAMFALNNVTASLSGSEVVKELKKKMEERYKKFNGYLKGVDTDVANLNNDHFRFVGVNMSNYDADNSKWYTNFKKSYWSNHQNPPASTYDSGKTNLYYRFKNNPNRTQYLNSFNDAEFTNELNFITDLTNCLSKLFNDILNANLLKNLGVQ